MCILHSMPRPACHLAPASAFSPAPSMRPCKLPGSALPLPAEMSAPCVCTPHSLPCHVSNVASVVCMLEWPQPVLSQHE